VSQDTRDGEPRAGDIPREVCHYSKGSGAA
jgi:hypothetical protein